MSSDFRGGSLAPFQQLPPFVDDSLTEAAKDSSLDLTPWAAYSLGYEKGMLPEMIRITQLAQYCSADCFNAIPKASFVIRLAVDILAPSMPAGIASVIRDAANNLEEFNNTSAVSFLNSGLVDWDTTMASYLGDRLLVSLRDPCMFSLSLLPWFGLGRAIGDFLCNDPTPSYHDAIPLHPILKAARDLPKAERDSLPELSDLASLIDWSDSLHERDLRQCYVVRLAHDWLADTYDPYPNSPHFTQEIEHLNDRITHSLLTRNAHERPVIEENVPRWDRRTHTLIFGGEMIRKYAGHATAVIKVLDEFQRLHWPVSIEIRVDGSSKQDVIRSINKSLKGITFYASGTKLGIGWRRV